MTKFAVLTTEGSPSAFVVLKEMAEAGRRPHTIVVLRPDARKNARRVLQKLYTAGPVATAKRVLTILKNRRRAAARSADVASAPTYATYAENVVYTSSFVEPDMLASLKVEKFDLFIAVTDEILLRRIFSVPRLGTLNAHPGENPRYRGLSAAARMVRDGRQPVVSVHLIDEGIDTGPLILRRRGQGPIVRDGLYDEDEMSRCQAQGFVEALQVLERDGRFPIIDTFMEESNMAARLTANQQAGIYAAAPAHLA